MKYFMYVYAYVCMYIHLYTNTNIYLYFTNLHYLIMRLLFG